MSVACVADAVVAPVVPAVLRVPLTAEAIARGVPGSTSSCALALAIRAIPFGRGRPRTVYVTAYSVRVGDGDRSVDFLLDERAERFRMAFDTEMHRTRLGRIWAWLFLGVSFRPFTFEMTRI
jgi:hypothetical protein